jgi:hypothetical protein
LWQQLLDQLSNVATGSTAAMAACEVLLGQLSFTDRQPAATWKALIQDMQVISLVCRSVLDSKLVLGSGAVHSKSWVLLSSIPITSTSHMVVKQSLLRQPTQAY